MWIALYCCIILYTFVLFQLNCLLNVCLLNASLTIFKPQNRTLVMWLLGLKSKDDLCLQVQKLKSTYVDSLLGFVKGTQLHTHWDHTAAATGRLTSTDPNIQAIPKVPLQITPVKETGELTGTGKRCIYYILYIVNKPLNRNYLKRDYNILKMNNCFCYVACI